MSISGSVLPVRLPAPRSEAGPCPDHAHVSLCTDRLSGRLEDLVAWRRELGEAVEALLEQGAEALATTFSAEWEAWRASTDVVLDDLRHGVAALRRAQLARQR